MDTTEIIIITIAIVLLVVALFTFNYFMTSVNKNLGWPPYESACPDFWVDKGNGVCFDKDKVIDPLCNSFIRDTVGDGSTAATWKSDTLRNDYLFKNKSGGWTNSNTASASADGLVYNPLTQLTTFPDVDSDYDGVSWNDSTSSSEPVTGTISVSTYAYFDPDKKNNVEMKKRKQWAKRCGLTWSGVTNTNKWKNKKDSEED